MDEDEAPVAPERGGAGEPERAGSERARVILLVGPKGVGKTTLGRRIEQRSGARFLEVEAIARRVLAASGGVVDEGYARRAFVAILEALRGLEGEHEVIVFETTGASEHSEWLVAELRRRYALTLVRVGASEATCARRISARDPSRQVSVPPELVRRMHAASASLAWPWDVEVDNEGEGSLDVLVERVLARVELTR